MRRMGRWGKAAALVALALALLASRPAAAASRRLTVDAHGARLDATGWSFGWSLRSYGPPASPEAADGGALLSRGARIEIVRRGLDEWFEEGEDGVRWGLRLSFGPPSSITTFDYMLAGSLTPKLSGDARELAFAG